MKELIRVIKENKILIIISEIVIFTVSLLVGMWTSSNLTKPRNSITSTIRLKDQVYAGAKGDYFTTITFFTFLVIFILLNIVFYKALNKFLCKQTRHIEESKRGTYGTASQMTEEEKQEALILTTYGDTKDEILGKPELDIKGQKPHEEVYVQNPDSNTNRFKLVVGPPGCGKTTGFINPNVIQLINKGESIIAADTKGSVYRDTCAYAKRRGYKVKVLNLVNLNASDSCRLFVSDDCTMTEAKGFVETLFANLQGKRVVQGDNFWEMGESNLICAAILYIVNDKSKTKEEKNLSALCNFLSQPINKIDLALQTLPEKHVAKQAANRYLSGTDTVRQSNVSGASNKLMLFQEEDVKNIVSYDEMDLTLPGQEKCIYYIIIPDTHSTYEVISGLFFTKAFTDLVKYADSTIEQHCKIPVNFLLDEFCSLGYISNYSRTITSVRSRWINITMIVQSIPYLVEAYDKVAKTILSSCDVNMLLGCNDLDTAKYFSERSGIMTVISASHDEEKTILGTEESSTEKKSEGKRMVFNPDEVMRLKFEEMIVNIKGHNSVKLYKNFYFNMPQYKELTENLVNPNDHIPEWKKRLEEEEKNKPVIVREETYSKPENNNTKSDALISDTNKKPRTNKKKMVTDGQMVIDPTTGEILEEDGKPVVISEPTPVKESNVQFYSFDDEDLPKRKSHSEKKEESNAKNKNNNNATIGYQSNIVNAKKTITLSSSAPDDF